MCGYLRRIRLVSDAILHGKSNPIKQILRPAANIDPFHYAPGVRKLLGSPAEPKEMQRCVAAEPSDFDLQSPILRFQA